MKMSYKDFSKKAIDNICDVFEYTHDIHYISTYFNINYNMVLSLLVSSGKYDDIIRNYQCQLDIKDKKIMFISDTHYGSVYDNINYAYDVFDFAKENSIKTIFHGGDILEGTSNNTNEILDIDDQIEYFLNRYPTDKGITTYAVLGNHDYLAIKPKSIRYHTLNSRKDINIMGFKKAFANWDESNIGLQHNIEKYKLLLSNGFHEDFCFKGHSHYFLIKEFEGQYHVHAPALCNDPSYYMTNQNGIDSRLFRPGFLTAEMFDDYMIVTNYYFDNNNSIVKGSEHPLTKKYKNTRN